MRKRSMAEARSVLRTASISVGQRRTSSMLSPIASAEPKMRASDDWLSVD
jgi:hypothetical protein